MPSSPKLGWKPSTPSEAREAVASAGKDRTMWNVGTIAELLLECGRIACREKRTVSREIKDDGTLVTRADKAVEALLLDRLRDPSRGRFVIAEESVDRLDEREVRAALAGTAWIVDPIDGTAPYAHNLPFWGVSVGLMQQGRLTDGAVIMPDAGTLFVTSGDRVLRFGFLPGNVPGTVPQPEILTPVLQDLAGDGMVALGQRFTKAETFPLPNPVLVTGCAVSVLLGLITGDLAAYVGHMKLWDLAGVLPMLERCGVGGTLLNGTAIDTVPTNDVFFLEQTQPRRWELRDTCIFGPTPNVRRLLERLGPQATR